MKQICRWMLKIGLLNWKMYESNWTDLKVLQACAVIKEIYV